MNVTRESDNPTEVTLNVYMESADEEPFLNRSYRRLAGRVRIPGFRPGKAPRSVVERHLGRAALVQEALEFMLPESLDQVLREQEIRAFLDPQLEVLNLEPVSFKATIALEPQIELGEFRSIRLTPPAVEIGPADINRVLERLQYESAPWEPADRPAAFGDLLTLSIHGAIDGQDVINHESVDYIPNMDNPHPLPGFSVYLEGMTEGQDKEFTLPVPPESAPGGAPDKECRFRVAIIAVKEKRLPELDDEFAKGVQDGFENIDALTEHIRHRLTQEAETAALRELERNSLEEVKKLATVHASELIYQREMEAIREEHERTLRSQRLDMETYLQLTGQTEQEWQTQLRPQAQDRLTTYLIIRKLAEQENIQVEPQEIEAEIQRLMQNSDQDSAANMRLLLNSPDSRESIRSNLLGTKVMARLVEIVKGDPTPETPESDTAPDTSDDEPQAAITDTPTDETTPDTPDDEPQAAITETPESETAPDTSDDEPQAAITETPATETAPDTPDDQPPAASAETPESETTPETPDDQPPAASSETPATDTAPETPDDHPSHESPQAPPTGESPNA